MAGKIGNVISGLFSNFIDDKDVSQLLQYYKIQPTLTRCKIPPTPAVVTGKRNVTSPSGNKYLTKCDILESTSVQGDGSMPSGSLGNLLLTARNLFSSKEWSETNTSGNDVFEFNCSQKEPLTNIPIELTPIKEISKENDEHFLNCNLSMINQSNAISEQKIESVVSKKTGSGSQTLKKFKDVSFKQEQLKEKSYILSCVGGGCVGLAIAYFVGATALTPVYITTGVFIGTALAGALLGYSIAKSCENKVETKIESPCANHHKVHEIEV